MHRGFGPAVLLLALALLVTAAVRRMPGRAVALAAGLCGLIILQWLLIAVPADGSLGVVRALHPVNAVAIFHLATVLVRRGRNA